MFGKSSTESTKSSSFFEDWTLFVSVMVALVALFFNVVLRYGFNYTLAWSEELVTRSDHLHHLHRLRCSDQEPLDDQDRRLGATGPQTEVPLSYFSNLVTMIFAVMMLYYRLENGSLQVATHQKTIIMQIPLVYLYAILPVMGATMLIRTIQVMYLDFNERACCKIHPRKCNPAGLHQLLGDLPPWSRVTLSSF